MKKRLMSLLAALSLLLSGPLTALAAGESETPKGSDFTDIPALARSLDGILADTLDLYGDIGCTRRAAAPVGSRAVPPGRTYYVKSLAGNVYSGTSCYIYANAVYATLFGDVPFHGQDAGWRRSENVASNLAEASFAAFDSAGVGFGALLRTTPNRDGSYNGSAGHSVILLKYDRQGLTYLEGNGDGQGLVRVTTRTWAQFNAVSLAGRGYRISFIVQPTASYMDSLCSGDPDRELVGYLRQVNAYEGRFRDVPGMAWYAPGVRTAYETGLLQGVSGTHFAPEGRVTVAEAVTLAARFLSLYYADGYSFTGSGPWYGPYYAYCAKWGIDTDFARPEEAVTRGQFARLMARALPEEAAGSAAAPRFPDVPAGSALESSVEKLAAGGILLGIDGRFVPDGALTRAQMAVIAARMADRAQRVR